MHEKDSQDLDKFETYNDLMRMGLGNINAAASSGNVDWALAYANNAQACALMAANELEKIKLMNNN